MPSCSSSIVIEALRAKRGDHTKRCTPDVGPILLPLGGSAPGIAKAGPASSQHRAKRRARGLVPCGDSDTGGLVGPSPSSPRPHCSPMTADPPQLQLWL